MNQSTFALTRPRLVLIFKAIQHMFVPSNQKIQSLVIHQIGNKSADEGLRLSKELLFIDDSINEALLTYFLSHFKSEELYNLYHASNLQLNEVFAYAQAIFENPELLYGQSIHIAKHLYEQSTHPKIKAGELYVVYFSDCLIDGQSLDAIGIFKSENKDTFLKVHTRNDGFNLESHTGININKLDKGCLIFNSESDKGYLVAVVDSAAKGSEAQYWMDQFLHIRPRNDEYFQTKNVLSMCKSFVVDKLPAQFEMTKADQVEMLNRSVKFFKDNDNFEMDDFTDEVLATPEVIQSFRSYKSEFEQDRDIEISESFSISESAVKKQSRFIKSVIKLDKNFHIYVHGDKNNIIKGYDEETGLHFYQLYFKEES